MKYRRAVARIGSRAIVVAFTVTCVGSTAVLGQRPSSGATATSSMNSGQSKPNVPGEEHALLEFGVPDSPAFILLGVSPTKVARPTSPRDLVASLANGVDSTGRIQTGIALGTTLWTFIPSLSIDLPTYQRGGFRYILANTQLSGATTRAAGDTASTNAAVGIRMSLVNKADPMVDPAFTRQLTGVLQGCLPEQFPEGGDQSAEEAKAVACASEKARKLRKEWFSKHWNAPSVALGAAWGWRFVQSRTDTIVPFGGNVWLAGAIPFLPSNAGQLIGHIEFSHRGSAATVDGSSISVLAYGGRIVRGGGPQSFFLEVTGASRLHGPKAAAPGGVQWSGGVEFEIVPQAWLVTGFGQRNAGLDQPKKLVVLASLRWGIVSAPRIATLHSRQS